MLDELNLKMPKGLRQKINNAYLADEKREIQYLIEKASFSKQQSEQIKNTASLLVAMVRRERKGGGGIDTFLNEYALSSEEGIALMCLAEALLRVPDKATIDKLIKDKLSSADWQAHCGQSDSFFVNATTWALMLTGKVLNPQRAESQLSKALMKLVNRTSEGVVRKAVDKAMRIMSKQFVMGRTIKEALKRAKKKEAEGFRYSYDMLGEAALTAKDANNYFKAYLDAIDVIGNHPQQGMIYQRPGVSIKLSALFPRYEVAKRTCVYEKLTLKLLTLAQRAKEVNISLTVDAEESERLDMSLDIIETVFSHPSLDDWNGFGMALQSYQKRAFYVLDWIDKLAQKTNKRMMLRLIKGAYWDSEIKNSQLNGFSEYPVFTRKCFTDVSFQACAKKIMSMTASIYPQFATHNAYSVAMILELVGDYRDFEFQCLHGMGNDLYQQIVPNDKYSIACRIYAPVGTHEDLLPYLVRRLLENGANSSFVNRISDDNAPIEKLVLSPIVQAQQLLTKINHNIPLPKAIYENGRVNSKGINLDDYRVLCELQQNMGQFDKTHWHAEPLIANKKGNWSVREVFSPHDNRRCIGSVSDANVDDIEWALSQACIGFESWSNFEVLKRAQCLEIFANLIEQHSNELMVLLIKEAGKTYSDCVAEIREAVDFCRYYAQEGIRLMANPTDFKGYTGETNRLTLHGRGIALCISPWNFPLAIFTGQICAALVCGNSVIAKPSEQTPLIACFLVNLMHQADIPHNVVQLLTGQGQKVGAALVNDRRIKLILFTGSTSTARFIYQSLARREGEIIPLIAETGGQNAMIVDSSALLEQVVEDVIQSAFGSAGQRCSALRVIYIQEEIYQRFNELLTGAMDELDVGNPELLKTDVGPVIDGDALTHLLNHLEEKKNQILYQTFFDDGSNNGTFVKPTLIALNSISELSKEHFGPILHIIRYKQSELERVINEINSTGFGLTLGIHSRVNSTIETIVSKSKVGNCYVNRNMIGAVVGLQPFGGERLSGTGPKAGGPHYLPRLCHERVVTINTTAAGGNASLMSLNDEEC
jgi:RHH-type transcriptional regulator, proline utilization regulon repressor / proline dehydrogenase / delta 1-pyrroline-5-carboxylate dehydrogenase